MECLGCEIECNRSFSCVPISYRPFLPTNKLSRKEVEVCIKKNLVDVFLVGSASEIFGERFSVTQTLESRVHETRVTCRERLLEFTERLLKFTGTVV